MRRSVQMCIRDRGMIDAGKLSEGQQMPTEEAIGALFSAVSYTHLDVYKRQHYRFAQRGCQAVALVAGQVNIRYNMSG